jgi:hypothetical protein
MQCSWVFFYCRSFPAFQISVGLGHEVSEAAFQLASEAALLLVSEAALQLASALCSKTDT